MTLRLREGRRVKGVQTGGGQGWGKGEGLRVGNGEELRVGKGHWGWGRVKAGQRGNRVIGEVKAEEREKG